MSINNADERRHIVLLAGGVLVRAIKLSPVPSPDQDLLEAVCLHQHQNNKKVPLCMSTKIIANDKCLFFLMAVHEGMRCI